MQVYEGKKRKVNAEEKRKIMANAAHLLNKLRSLADETETPLSAAEENHFWDFISILPEDVQSSVIN